MRAMWNGTVIADSDDTVVVEGNHYFPIGSVNPDLLRESATHSTWPTVMSAVTLTFTPSATRRFRRRRISSSPRGR